MPMGVRTLSQMACHARLEASGAPGTANVEVVAGRESETAQATNAHLRILTHVHDQYVGARETHILMLGLKSSARSPAGYVLL